MIIGKRQIILATLVLGLAIAIWLNWQFSKSEQLPGIVKSVDSIKNYGEAEFVKRGEIKDEEDVTMTAAKIDEYFAQTRLDRNKSRDGAIDILKKMSENPNLDKEQKDKLVEEVTKLSKFIELEGKAENLIKAKGFADAIVYAQDDKVTITVQTDNFTDLEAAKIKEIILKEIQIAPENIAIIPMK